LLWGVVLKAPELDMPTGEIGPSPELLGRLALNPRDESAWRQLYLEARPLVFAMAFRRLRGAKDIADDVTQEVFARLALYLPFDNLRTPVAFRGYLWSTTRNVIIDYMHKVARGQEVLGDTPDAWLDDLARVAKPSERDDPARILEYQEALEGILSVLSEVDRRIIEFLIQGWALAEIADELDISYNNVSVRLHRARTQIALHLRARQQANEKKPRNDVNDTPEMQSKR
jgi:RNA polymerase sigma factor (sigma-70 family)